MIADALRVVIERYADRFERENPLFLAAVNGSVTPEMAQRYLTNVRHLIRLTQVHLDEARAGALARGDIRLAEHYVHKQAEERGHDRWADADLEALHGRFAVPHGEAIVPALVGLIGYIEETIEREPALYLAYLLFVERLVALRGDRWLDLVELRCGIPRDMLTVVGNHAKLDREHAEEGLEVIDALVRDPAMLAPMRQTLEASIDYFERFCGEIVASTGARAWAESSPA